MTIARDPLDGPTNLSVEPVPQGGALDLSWQAGGSDITHYQIQRADNSGGPYQIIATSVATAYRDSGLDNGVTYYYVVIGIDGAGNQSPPAPEASGTPADSVATGNTRIARAGICRSRLCQQQHENRYHRHGRARHPDRSVS